ncbi:putative damage-inducible protein DinB [Geomicrobium halophilum]|uniref:Putative damage-inducible protein DinB n=1 Tax=Geomicrobium halophilum TaxID=549000 RepID=A0A841PN50_9BACL|nr:DinB family protein [Geomicrobium halophilum]MBB6450277.1 putative damage-inducible protein DinB [Geomicrobium halophilum]
MGSKQIFLRQLSACHDENHWFACLQQALSGVTDDQANWKREDSDHCIHEIVNHLIVYNSRCLDRFKGEPVPPIEEGNESTFHSVENRDWSVTMAQVTTMMDEWVYAIQETKDSTWLVPIHEESDETWGTMIANMMVHTSYHIGQIVYIRKQQGAWDVEEESLF